MEVATQFFRVMMKIQAYGTALSLAMTFGCTILMLKTRDKAGDGNILVPHEKRSSETYLYQKILLTFLWDKKRSILEYYHERDKTVSNATYSAMLKDKVKPEICNKRKGLLSQTILLHHDNAHPHVTVATKQSETSSLRLCHIHLAVPTLHHATFKPLDHLQKHYVVASLVVIK